jgi:hypothetical protein
MTDVGHKTQVANLDGTPEKRMFWSIISDYNLKLGLCELVDNAIDLWQSQGRKSRLRISVHLDVQRQLIEVYDNAGGVKYDELRFLVAPGGSRNDPTASMIGIFGVGSKRAGVALGERVVIKTRYKKEPAYEVDITKDWLESPDWELAAYRIQDIESGTTLIEISHLRRPIQQSDINDLRTHFGEVYAHFIAEGCDIYVESSMALARTFANWAYPAGYAPKHTVFNVHLAQGGDVNVDITAGLIIDRLSERDNYGVYIYCNRRLIVKELKVREVGYVTGQAGVPHSDASLCRVIVRLDGPAQAMPWNSSKSGINYSHQVFELIREQVVSLVSYFSSLSRRLRDDWDGTVFRHTSGSIEEVDREDARSGRLILPKLPRATRARAEQLRANNRSSVQSKPWTLGLVEGMAAVEIIRRQHLETKNRIALILLDSNFEIALKEFIVHREDIFPKSKYTEAFIGNLFGNRSDVIAHMTRHVTLLPDDIKKAQHYYLMRNKLIHERATTQITDIDVDIYQATVQRVLKTLFGLRF